MMEVGIDVVVKRRKERGLRGLEKEGRKEEWNERLVVGMELELEMEMGSLGLKGVVMEMEVEME